jgi:ATP-dependent Lhr-like helicase
VARELGEADEAEETADTGKGAAARRRDVEAAAAVATALLERYGVLTREAVRAEAVPGGFSGIYPVLRSLEESGRIRRGYFLAGMGGAQFALPGAGDGIRELGRRGRGGGGGGGAGAPRVHVLAATDPANAYGAVIPWPVKGPSRVPGAYVVLVGGEGSLYVERGGRGLLALREADGTWEEPAVDAVVDLVRRSRTGRLVLQRHPEELTAVLEKAGFTPGPKGLVLYR